MFLNRLFIKYLNVKNALTAMVMLFAISIVSAFTVFTERTVHNCSYTGEDINSCTISED